MARILIIEDEEPLRTVLAKSLTYAGHVVIEAENGRQGVELFREAPTDLVITDLIMPVQEGDETILALRKEHPRLPIIAISGGDENSPRFLKIAEKFRPVRILAKPFPLQELRVMIEEVLSSAEVAG